MPRGVRTGPDGTAQMTGRGAGYCSGNDKSGSNNPDAGRGAAFGPGRGRGAGKGLRQTDATNFTPATPEKDVLTFPPVTPVLDEKESSEFWQLKDEVHSMFQSLEGIHKGIYNRIEALENTESTQ